MKRWIALGAIIGLVASLAFTLAMPSRAVRSIYIPAVPGQRVAVYGVLQPYAPQRFSVATTQHSPQIARDVLLGFIAGAMSAAALVSVGRARPRSREP